MRATNIAHSTQKQGDIETNNTTAPPNKGPLKPRTPLHPKTAPESPISHPQRRWRFQLRLSLREQRRQGFHTTGPPGLQGQAAVPAGDDDTTASQISHAIRLEEVSTTSENVAIPTLLIHDSKESRGNCMRNWGSSAMMWILINTTHPTGAEGAGGTGGHGCCVRGRRRGLTGQQADAPIRTSAHQAPLVWRAPAVTGGPGCDAHGRRGLAGLRDDAPSHTSAIQRRRCGGCRRDRRARAGFEARRRTK